MKLTKFGHSCIRLESTGGALVIDPGCLTEAIADVGADAILITHEHFDHFAEGRVRAAARANHRLQVWTVPAVAELLSGLGGQLHIVRDGDVFVTAGFEVEAHGCWHAVLHRDIPVVANTGFLIDGRLFHPGDALTVPAKPVTTLMVPVHGLWSQIADVIDWVREVAPQRTFATHDGFLSPMGIAITGGMLGENGPGIDATYRRLEPLDEVDGI